MSAEIKKGDLVILDIPTHEQYGQLGLAVSSEAETKSKNKHTILVLWANDGLMEDHVANVRKYDGRYHQEG